jgi:hypothetical protein
MSPKIAMKEGRRVMAETAGSVAGAISGSWLMHRKLDAPQVKKIIGVVLHAIAVKMLWEFL